MSRSMCLHTYDTLCIDEFNPEKDTIADDCENCPYYNGGKDIYSLSEACKKQHRQESLEAEKNKLYIQALEWWDRLTPIEKIGIRKVIKDIQGDD